MPNFSAIRTNSANDPARIFCIALLRWILTLNSVVPSLAAICLLSRPLTTKRQYFAFAWRQRDVPRTLFSNLSLALSICAVALDGLVNRIEQRMKTVWSETQPHRPSSPVTLHCYIDTDRQMFILFVKSILDASSFCQARKRKANISSSSALFVLTRSPTPDSDRMLES
jgi:hypothetical protein